MQWAVRLAANAEHAKQAQRIMHLGSSKGGRAWPNRDCLRSVLGVWYDGKLRLEGQTKVVQPDPRLSMWQFLLA